MYHAMIIIISPLLGNCHDIQVSFVKGEVVTGTVVQFEPTGALVDIGAKATAYMPAREVRTDNMLQAQSSTSIKYTANTYLASTSV